MLGKGIALITLMALVALTLLLQTLSPTTAGPLGILAVFFLFYIVSVGVSTGLILLGSGLVSIARRLRRGSASATPVARPRLRHAYYFGTIIGLAPVMLIGMGSVGQVGIYEAGLVLLFIIIGVFYVQKRL